jgi:3-oxoacyl-[acyl-carrier protein] reductase
VNDRGLLDGRTAVITGGAGGLGQAMARRFADEGARVAVVDLNADTAAEFAATLPRDAFAVRADVTSPEDVAALTERVIAETGSIDVFVNNAGITRDASIRKMSLEQWDAVHNVHLRGAFIAIKAVAEPMRAQGGGAIVNISSISGKVGNFGQANYSSAKAGLVGLTKVAAKELAKYGVRVNAIQPGLIRTAMTEVLAPEIWKQKLAEIPMGRAGEPDEVAKAALFLASDQSSYMTGTVLEVTGGRYM